ncbi:MAG: uroporphyrinogen decarboxylase family protein, partial [Bacteroidota bacterium]
ARAMLYRDPVSSHLLLEKIARATAAYLKEKVRHGADLIQLFDSWAGVLPSAHYQEFSLRYILMICEELPDVPVTVFAKDARHALPALGQLPCQVIQLDWIADPKMARAQVQADKVLQGNLDPVQLYAPEEEIVAATKAMMAAYGDRHIVNLGHGVYPDTPLDGVKAFVNTVKSHRY